MRFVGAKVTTADERSYRPSTKSFTVASNSSRPDAFRTAIPIRSFERVVIKASDSGALTMNDPPPVRVTRVRVSPFVPESVLPTRNALSGDEAPSMDNVAPGSICVTW